MDEAKITKKRLEQSVIDADDVGHTIDFFSYFDIPMPGYLKKALDTFKQKHVEKHKELENAEFLKSDHELIILCNEVRFALAKTISESTHPIFTDVCFADERNISGEVAYNYLFDQEVEKTLSVKP
jgi:hypothetical protein